MEQLFGDGACGGIRRGDMVSESPQCGFRLGYPHVPSDIFLNLSGRFRRGLQMNLQKAHERVVWLEVKMEAVHCNCTTMDSERNR